jgi:hypothetical protein
MVSPTSGDIHTVTPDIAARAPREVDKVSTSRISHLRIIKPASFAALLMAKRSAMAVKYPPKGMGLVLQRPWSSHATPTPKSPSWVRASALAVNNDSISVCSSLVLCSVGSRSSKLASRLVSMWLPFPRGQSHILCHIRPFWPPAVQVSLRVFREFCRNSAN